MNHTVLTMLCQWAVIGFFLLMLFPKPENRRQAWGQLLVAGPIGWILFILISLRMFLDWRRS